jgi:hypothetical protein
LTGKGAYDCAGIFVDPSFLSPTAMRDLADPVVGLANGPFSRAFDLLADEMTGAGELLPLFAEGWAMQALAYVARAARPAGESRRTIEGQPGTVAAAPGNRDVAIGFVCDPEVAAHRSGMQVVWQCPSIQDIDRATAASVAHEGTHREGARPSGAFTNTAHRNSPHVWFLRPKSFLTGFQDGQGR